MGEKRPDGDVVAPLPDGWRVDDPHYPSVTTDRPQGYAHEVTGGHGRAGDYIAVAMGDAYVTALVEPVVHVLHERGALDDYFHRRRVVEFPSMGDVFYSSDDAEPFAVVGADEYWVVWRSLAKASKVRQSTRGQWPALFARGKYAVGVLGDE